MAAYDVTLTIRVYGCLDDDEAKENVLAMVAESGYADVLDSSSLVAKRVEPGYLHQ